MAHPIEDYALIGDGQTAALVARDGGIDWLCWPRFDSDACFAALLGTPEHGQWRIGPDPGMAQISRRYRTDTLVLETEFTTANGTARLIDFMPMRPDGASTLIRLVEGVQGEVEMSFELNLRFDFGSLKPWIRAGKDRDIVGVVGPDLVVLRSDLDLDAASDTIHRRFVITQGETRYFTLQHGLSHLDAPDAVDPRQALAETEQFWRNWIGGFDRPTDWPEALRRSLITLKALMHRPTGGLVAAPTLGLPEIPGGDMNWDYRYCWLRDATFTLSAFLNAGFQDDARAWFHWLLRAVAGEPDKMRIMYRVDGSRRLEEWTIPWLPGYEGALPVRVGNQAAAQLQLDMYGEVLDSIHLATQAGMERTPWGIEVEARLVAHLEDVWRHPDQGLWESRDKPQHYVYSKVMCWVAIDRFLKGEATRNKADAATLDRLHALRDEMHAQICDRGYNRRLGHFVQHYGSHQLDASLLLLPLVNFLPIDDPRITGTIAAIERDLLEDGLVRRSPSPALGQQEGVFIACSCWLVDCMALQGRTDAARTLFEKVLALRNDVGLLSEEYHVPSRRLIGNFPQALSHLALVNSGLSLCGKVLQRGGG